jgi:hypothetical protein
MTCFTCFNFSKVRAEVCVNDPELYEENEEENGEEREEEKEEGNDEEIILPI